MPPDTHYSPHTQGGGRCYPLPRRGRPAPHPAPEVALKSHPPPTRPKGRRRCYPPLRWGRPDAYPPRTGAAHPGPPTPPRNPGGGTLHRPGNAPPYKEWKDHTVHVAKGQPHLIDEAYGVGTGWEGGLNDSSRAAMVAVAVEAHEAKLHAPSKSQPTATKPCGHLRARASMAHQVWQPRSRSGAEAQSAEEQAEVATWREGGP